MKAGTEKRRGLARGGFTLVEMLVVLTIMMILFGIMAPVISVVKTKGGVDASAQELKAALLHARSLAARYNAVYSVVFNNAAVSGGTWHAGDGGGSEDADYWVGNTIDAKVPRKSWKVATAPTHNHPTDNGDGAGHDTGDHSGCTWANNPHDHGDSGAAKPAGLDSTNPSEPDVTDNEITWTLTSFSSIQEEGDYVWYAIIGPNPGTDPDIPLPTTGGMPVFYTASQFADSSYNTDDKKLEGVETQNKKHQIGKKFHLKEGAEFDISSWKGDNEDGDGHDTGDHSGCTYTDTLSVNNNVSGLTVGMYGDLRVMFAPTGEAVFFAGIDSGNGIAKNSGNFNGKFKIKSTRGDAASLTVVINKFTGLVSIEHED